MTPFPENNLNIAPSGYPAVSGPVSRLEPRYYGSVGYYAEVAACGGNAVMDGTMLFDKRRKQVHRCDIADVNGVVQLTVPVGKPHGIPRATWSDVRVSNHGRWWHVHRVTLESAYGRTPFFEFYIDRFAPFLCAEAVERYPSIIDFDAAIDAVIREILLLPPAPVFNAVAKEEGVSEGASADAVQTAASPDFCSGMIEKPHYQVRAAGLGYIPGLSVLDLIFNLGPEAPLYLAEMASRCVRSQTECGAR